MRGLALVNYILSLPGIALTLSIHGYFRSLISYRLGNPYPKLHGQIRFNPKSHFEPIGFILMLLYGYGWGMPVKAPEIWRKDRKRGALIIFAAPSLINLLFAFVFFIILMTARQLSFTLGYNLPLGSQGFAQSIQTISGLGYTVKNMLSAQPVILIAAGTIYQVIYMFVRCNIAVAIINLIPVYPLDGSAILENCLPPEYRYKFGQYEGILLAVLLLLFFAGIVNAAFDPIIQFLLRAVQ